MVNTTVDNSPVSITLTDGESTTVPNGEVWRVNITVGNGFGESFDNDGKMEINGHAVASFQYFKSGNASMATGPTGQIVLTGGDTVSYSGGGGGAHIGGFVVN